MKRVVIRRRGHWSIPSAPMRFGQSSTDYLSCVSCLVRVLPAGGGVCSALGQCQTRNETRHHPAKRSLVNGQSIKRPYDFGQCTLLFRAAARCLAVHDTAKRITSVQWNDAASLINSALHAAVPRRRGCLYGELCAECRAVTQIPRCDVRCATMRSHGKHQRN